MVGTRITMVVTALGAAFFLSLGVWAFAAPHSFYDQIASFPPYNRHLLHDAGAFQIGIGAALLLALLTNDALFVALAAAGIGSAVHAASHVIDHDLGGKDTDAPLLALLALLLLVGAALRWAAIRATRA